MAVFVNAEGYEYETDDQTEITRLRYYRGQVEQGLPESDPATVRFHPEEHPVGEVLEYIEAHPRDADRVLGEEQGGKKRKTILGE